MDDEKAEGGGEGRDALAIHDHSPRFLVLPPETGQDAQSAPPADLTDPESPDFRAAEAAFVGADPPHHVPNPARPKPHRIPKRHRWGTFWLMLTLIFLTLAGLFAALALSGKPLRLPVWAVVEAEQRLNTTLREVSGGAASLSVGGAVFVVDEDWVPRLRLEDVRLLEQSGATFLSLPELRLALDPGALATGQMRLRSLRLIGANISLRRLPDGQFDLALGLPAQPRRMVGLSGVIEALVAGFDLPSLSYLRQVEAQALTITLDDQMLGRVWDLGDGRLVLANRADDLAVELGMSVIGGQAASQVNMTLIAAKADASARMTVTVDSVAAPDIAAQAAPLAWLGVVDAAVSGQIASTLNASGALASLEASLTLDKGALRPNANVAPVEFDGASLFFGYDPARERLELRDWTVTSQDIALRASGHAYLPGVTQGIPSEVIAQIQIASLELDPQGLLDAPVGFEQGALDLRVRLDPFGIDIGQAVLTHQGQRLQASGRVDAGPKGWAVAVDARLDQIPHDRLLALWPPKLVAGTRNWVVDNLQEGLLTNVVAGFRLAPEEEPRLSLGYEYSGADVRFLKTLPPIQNGRGYAVVEGKTYTLVVEEGWVSAPLGGAVDVAGSVFAVEDVTVKPARAEIAVKAAGDLTAALSLLDQEPFRFITKARLPVALGTGRAEVVGQLRLPLQKGNTIANVDYDVTGKITGFTSDKLIPGREMRADRLDVTLTPTGMAITGKGQLQGVPFEARYTKAFAPADKGLSSVEGTAELSADAATKLGVGLPEGLISGRGAAAFTVQLREGQKPKLSLRSNLVGVGMVTPALGWAKGTDSAGELVLDITLGQPAAVDSFSLDAAGLRATGQISLAADGGLGTARLSSVRLGNWLDVAVELTGRGRGRAPGVALTGGTLDLRGLPTGGGASGGAGGGPIALALDRVTVTDGLSLTAFRSTLTAQTGGMSGNFTGRINGQTPVSGSLAPGPRGTAIRLRSADAGAVFSAAKIFPNAQGGEMDLVLAPTGAKGTYDGNLTMTGVRIRKAPALAELINAISVVGLLEQLQGSGLLFAETEAVFRLTPRAVQINRASAVGASLGVSLSGLYVLNGGRLDMQGVVSPIYLLNGIGAIFTRKGEGLFGFNYRVQGTASAPDVSVNPLSILTPGMFREIFRSPPPQLEPNE